VPTTLQLLADPDWIPHRVDVRAGAIRFVHLPRAVQRTITFLADEYLPAGTPHVDTPSAELATRLPGAGRLHFVFHSAFCCSTLLARALDVPGRMFALKEPMALNDLASAQLARSPAPRIRELLDQTLKLLARSPTPDEAVVLKPSNLANGLLETCLELRPASCALLMYSPLRGFLRSIARRGLWGRGWARQLYQTLRPLSSLDPGYTADELFRQTDLQVAALCWLMHRAQFVRALERVDPRRVRTLESSTLLERPVESLQAVGALFGSEISAEQATAIARGPAFTENSKSFVAGFDRERRAEDHAAADAAYGAEIDMVVGWADQVARHCGLPATLAAPLLR
jgi:hypothetical protein